MTYISGNLLSLFLIVAVSNRAQAQTDGIIISEILANPSDESKREFV